MSEISPLSEDDVLIAIDKGKSEGGPHGQHWVLDPIDGTKGFERRSICHCISILDEGKVVLGVLAWPNLPLGSVACHDQRNPDSKVHVSPVDNPEEASFLESFEAAHSMHELSSMIARKLGVKAPPVRIDSQAKYGALSRGDGAIYLRFPHKEAGGIAADAGGNPLDFSRGRYLDLDTGIIVTNQKLMPSLLKAVQESIKEKSL